MSKKWIALSLFAFVLTAGWALTQGSASLFDKRKAEKELQVMEGILRTTLKFVTSEFSDDEAVAFASRAGSWLHLGGSSVDSFYLYDQGVVFVVDLPGIRMGRRAADARTYSAIAGELVSIGNAGQGRRERAAEISRERLLELQEKVKQQQEEYKQEAEQHGQRLDEVKGHLIEALANHGDSLTLLGDDEYINLVLNSPSDGWLVGTVSRNRLYTGSSRPEYISVKKSWINDYKAGRLNLDQFKQKALSY